MTNRMNLTMDEAEALGLALGFVLSRWEDFSRYYREDDDQIKKYRDLEIEVDDAWDALCAEKYNH